jgi:endonuclease VIII
VPEGDTIWRVAARLRPALVDRPLVRFDAPRLVGPRPRPGETITAVDAVGKHLLVRFSGGVVLQTHLRMTGSWHLYRTGERWQRAPHLARVTITVPEWVAVCFTAPVVRTATSDEAVAHLGPDLTSPAPDLDAAVARWGRLDGDTLVVDALLDQRVAAGVGNVYKSEVLWAERVHPATPVGGLVAGIPRRLLGTAHRLLRANLGAGDRITVPGAPGGLGVYRRRGRPCVRCGTPVERAVMGATARSTYWCPRCQPGPATPVTPLR